MNYLKQLGGLWVVALLSNCSVGAASGQQVYWTDIGSSKIQRANLDGSEAVDLVTTGVILPTGIALDVPGGKMYWTEASPADFMIMRADLDGTQIELLVTGLTTPSGIALDTVAGKMYWTDIGTGKIQRANLDGMALEDLVTIEGSTPVGIALDPASGKMYWTEGSPADFMILRADLDGANVELVVGGLVSPSGIALDVAGDKMYWTDIGSSKIQRANLDGSEVEDLVTTPVVFTPVGLALNLAEGQMYWTESTLGDFMILRAGLDGSNVELLVTHLVSPSGIALDIPSVSCPADLDDDGAVSSADLAILLGAWGPVPTPDPPDFDGDGDVDAADLAQLLGSWGPCPEPKGCQGDEDCPDDGIFCNGPEECLDGSCEHMGINCPAVICGDTCNEEQQSCNSPAGTPCGDGDACTIDVCDGTGGCVIIPVGCGPTDGCCSPGCDAESDADCPP